jgi:hypothetical protein
MKYYNSDKESKINMFHSIQTNDETNDAMEDFMIHLKQFNESDEYTKKLLNVNDIEIESYDQIFGLKINNTIICVCEILFPILDYIAKNIDWVKIDWKIVSTI